METALVKIDAQQFGLQATEAEKVEVVFLPMIEKMKELETEFNEVLALPVEPTTCKKAKELRLKFVRIRTGTAEIHKNAKEYYRKGGLFVDAWKNAQAFASQGKEEQLEKIEKYFETLEAERKAKLKTDRTALLIEVCETPEMYPLQDMSEPAFAQLFMGLQLAKKQKEDAERKAEEERIAKVKAEAEERERIRFENERLRAEAIERECVAKEEREKQERLLAAERAAASEAKKKAEEEKRAIEEKARKEREKAEVAAKAEREKAQAAQRAVEEKARQERLAAQAKADVARQEAAAKAKAEKEKQEKALAAERERSRLAAEKAKAEREELERKLADLIKCPKCNHEFSISQTKKS